MDEAPLLSEIARGPRGGRGFWCHAADGVRLRLALWPAPAGGRGTVFLFPGRTEYVEKYGLAAADLAAHGYGTFSIDWRGQGLSERLAANPMLGHVAEFAQYQLDVAAMLEAARALELPRPWFLLGHSMGGCIGLRALHREMPVAAAAFSGPMWGIALSPLLRPLAVLLAAAAHALGLGERYAPGTDRTAYVLSAPFEDNLLTTDRQMWDYMAHQLRSHPELILAGPSFDWFNAARRECAALMALPPPRLPALVFLGGNERIVDPRPVHALMRRWEQGRLEVVPGAEHEIMMERPQIRCRFFAAAAQLFASAGACAATAARP